jgi:hypothetical protein
LFRTKDGKVGINNIKNAIMKKLFGLLVLSIALVSCYDEYIKDFDYDGVYFTYQIDTRTVVVGEGMTIEIGVALAGVMENKVDRNVTFSIDNALVTPAVLTSMKNGATYIKNAVAGVTTLSPIPSNYYTLSDNSKIVIKAGKHTGSVVFKADSAAFLADAATINAAYALPLYIATADADTILETKRTSVIGIKYENMLFGNYWHGGVTTVKDAGGTTIQTINYKTSIPTAENTIWVLKTVAPNVLVTNGYSNVTTSKGEMRLTLDGTNITVSSNTGSTFVVQPDGTSSFNRPNLLQDRKIYLNYKYVNAAGNTCYAKDTLTFRNRIRDGVNEWQDANPSHY